MKRFCHVALNRGLPGFVGAGVGGGVAGLSAGSLTRTSSNASGPYTATLTRPIDWQDGDMIVGRYSSDPTFATGVTEGTPVVLAASTTAQNLGFAAAGTVGPLYFQAAAWRNTRPATLNWSVPNGFGDAVAPTITSTAAPSGYQFAAGSMTLTANKGVTWEIVGGTGFAQFTLVGNTLSWLSQSTAGTLQAIVRATSYFNVPSTDQTITLTLVANTASPFSFAPTVNAINATSYSPALPITVSGLAGGGAAPLTASNGALISKNGGTFAVPSSMTVVNGDTILPKVLSATTSDTTAITIGSTIGTYTVTTSATTPASIANIKDYCEVRASKLWKDTAATVPVTADGDLVARMDSELGVMGPWLQATAGNRPTYKVSGGVEWLDGVTDDFMDYASTGLSGIATATTPFYLAMAIKLDALGPTYTINDGSSSARALIYAEQVAAVNYYRMFGTTGSATNWGATPTTNDVVIGALFNGASSSIRLDGVTGTVANSGTAGLTGGGRIGATHTSGSSPIDGRFYGWALVAANPPEGDRASLDTSLGGFQGRTL